MAYLDDSANLQAVRELYLSRLVMPELTAERARIVTASYERTAGLPMVLRRAHALRDILAQMTVYLQPWELLAGNLGPEPVSAPLFPEGGADYVLEELDSYSTRPGDKFSVSKETKAQLRELLPRWKGHTLREYGLALMPCEAVRMREAGVFGAENMLTCGTGHFLPDYARILRSGFAAVRVEAEAGLAALDLSTEEGFRRRSFYESVVIICDAVRAFALRYAELAETMAADAAAAEVGNGERVTELRAIAARCRRVPEQPAKTFAEALQSLWLTHVICYIDSNGYGVTLGRSAAYLYPYFRADIDEGRIDEAQVVTLLISFFFKTNDILKLYNNAAAENYGGFPVGQPVQLGGLGPGGVDDVNELSFLFLEAERRVKLYQPDIGLLWTAKIDRRFLEEAVGLVATNSKPKFFNYHVGSEMYLQAGLPQRVANEEWAFIGCVEYGVPGQTWTWADAAMFNLPKCLELALNNGVDPVTAVQLGPRTGTFESFNSFAELREAFFAQIRHMFALTVQGITALQVAHKDRWPEPYESLLVGGCLQSGLDVNDGGAASYQTGVQFVGLATVIDSLMALKSYVYERCEIDAAELLAVLRADFAGQEVLRMRLYRGTSRFGMDLEEVNEVAAHVFSCCCEVTGAYRDIWGGIYTASFYTLTAHVGFGRRVGATPDGRHAFTPLSDASSPSQGALTAGITEIFATQSKLPHHKAINGTLLNVKINKQLFAGAEQSARLADLISAYFKMGGFHVQFNVVDVELLRDAQAHPENYPDLLIRVAAYVTNWNQLSRDVQNEIIARSEIGSL